MQMLFNDAVQSLGNKQILRQGKAAARFLGAAHTGPVMLMCYLVSRIFPRTEARHEPAEVLFSTR